MRAWSPNRWLHRFGAAVGWGVRSILLPVATITSSRTSTCRSSSPADLAENRRRRGLSRHRPGKRTAEYIDRILTPARGVRDLPAAVTVPRVLLTASTWRHSGDRAHDRPLFRGVVHRGPRINFYSAAPRPHRGGRLDDRPADRPARDANYEGFMKKVHPCRRGEKSKRRPGRLLGLLRGKGNTGELLATQPRAAISTGDMRPGSPRARSSGARCRVSLPPRPSTTRPWPRGQGPAGKEMPAGSCSMANPRLSPRPHPEGSDRSRRSSTRPGVEGRG